MSISPLAKNIQFGVASPAYRSRSAGTDFEEILGQIRDELKAAEMHYTRNLMSASGLSSKNRYPTAEEADLLSVSSLFSMDATEFSLLDELLMAALEETRLAVQNAGAEESALEAQVDNRYKMDVSKLGNLLKKTG